MNEFITALEEVFDENLFTISGEDRQRVVSDLMDWLLDVARKKPVPDLAQRIEGMRQGLEKMARNVSIELQKGRLVIKTDADSQALLAMFRRGTTWFNPHDDVDSQIIAALLSGAT